ncbi:hypothetical protein [Corynebacterium falsenii]|uniref:hypothetical protein n=1 Tax=Corynebacterium falsenii TaxID=108486 RepID=UPI001D9861D7|nr:hypothetical protein [Corynebacterium falsenii]HJF12124.1 endonuclease domain-containing protein [Corynebacterium falsenii]
MQDDNTQRDSMTDQIAHFPQTALRTTADDKFGIPHDYLRQSLEDTKQHTAQQCADFSARLYKSRNLVFTCITALKLSAVELPWCNLPQDEFHILASSDNKRSHVSSARFMVWTHSIEAMQSITIDDRKIWFTDPITTWAIMAKFLSQDEVIVLADAICRAKPQGIPLQKQDFTDYLTMDERFIGKRKCRDAMPFIGTPLDSSMEMRCVIALLRFGLPRPETGYPIVITALNRTVHVDMAYPEFHVIIEYDGDAHRLDKAQHRWDERKREALRAMGYTVIVVFADTFSSQQRTREFAENVAQALGVELPGIPLEPYTALLNDQLLAEDRLRQRRCRARKRRELALG